MRKLENLLTFLNNLTLWDSIFRKLMHFMVGKFKTQFWLPVNNRINFLKIPWPLVVLVPQIFWKSTFTNPNKKWLKKVDLDSMKFLLFCLYISQALSWKLSTFLPEFAKVDFQNNLWNKYHLSKASATVIHEPQYDFLQR